MLNFHFKNKLGFESRKLTLPQIAVIFVMMLVVAINSTMVTYAWVSRNRLVDVKNVNMRYDVDTLNVGGVHIDGQVITLVNPGDTVSSSTGEKDTLIPGSVLTMKIGIANTAEKTETVTTLGFAEPAIWIEGNGGYDDINTSLYDEIPTKSGDEYYYLGTQLTISVTQYTVYEYELQQLKDTDGNLQYDDNGQPLTQMVIKETVSSGTLTDMTPVYLTTVADGGVSYATTVRNDLSITLAENHLIAFDVVITFVETGTEQNVYQNFGNTSAGKAKFTRTLTIDVGQ